MSKRTATTESHIDPLADEALRSIDEGAGYLGISPRKFASLIASGEIDVVRIGVSVRVTPAALRRFVSEREGRDRPLRTVKPPVASKKSPRS